VEHFFDAVGWAKEVQPACSVMFQQLPEVYFWGIHLEQKSNGGDSCDSIVTQCESSMM